VKVAGRQCFGNEVTLTAVEIGERVRWPLIGPPFVSKERARKDAHPQAPKEAVLTWNAFSEKHSIFADEHSTL
jgi:hypothetical protein